MKHPNRRLPRVLRDLLLSALCALLVAVGMHVFVFPAAFAPSGMDGIATVLQSLTGLNAGLFTALINAPLLVAAWFVLKRRYVLYTLLYTLLFSLFLFLLAKINFYQYVTDDRIIPVLFGGLAQGLTGIMLRLGASSGGVDVIASMIQKRLPHKHTETVISWISYSVVLLSLPVYRSLESALLSILEIYVCERVSASILRTSRHAVRFEIVAPSLDPLRFEILNELGRGATVLHAQGLFSGNEKKMVVCVADYRQIPALLSIVSRHPDTFVCYADVMGVLGEFER
ncbi:MAG: YitT family protein [Clostridia bacterium]|nr:YitT family protein [Clostridia bacterium]